MPSRASFSFDSYSSVLGAAIRICCGERSSSGGLLVTEPFLPRAVSNEKFKVARKSSCEIPQKRLLNNPVKDGGKLLRHSQLESASSPPESTTA